MKDKRIFEKNLYNRKLKKKKKPWQFYTLNINDKGARNNKKKLGGILARKKFSS